MSKVTSTSLHGAVALAHFFLRARVRPGDRVVDATCGNGHDTLLLARLVGVAGRVWAFDLQDEALAATRKLLTEAGCMTQTELVAAGHERLAEFVGEPVSAVVFNLGYLPGGDKSFVTCQKTTLAALDQAARLILPGGFIAVCVYTGHPGGREEGEEVTRWGASLDPRQFNVWLSRPGNRSETAPYLVLVERGK